MKSCMRSCVNLISLVSASSHKLRTFSSCGLIWMTKTPKSVLSSCMDRNAFAKLCCSGDSDSMASLNSLGVGIVAKSSGMVNSSLFCTMAAYFGSKVVEEVMRPTSTMKELNCRALETRARRAPVCPENLFDNHAWRWRSPPKVTCVEAPKAKLMRCSEAGVHAERVAMGVGMLAPSPPTLSSSMLRKPSGLWALERRMAKQKGAGAKASAKSFRLWKRMYSAKSAGVTSLPMAAMSCLRIKSSMYCMASAHCTQTPSQCRNVAIAAASAPEATTPPEGNACSRLDRAELKPRASSANNRFISATPSTDDPAAPLPDISASTPAAPASGAPSPDVSIASRWLSSSNGRTGTMALSTCSAEPSILTVGSGCTCNKRVRWQDTDVAQRKKSEKWWCASSTSAFLRGVWQPRRSLSMAKRGASVARSRCLTSQLMLTSATLAGLVVGCGAFFEFVFNSTCPVRCSNNCLSLGSCPVPRTAYNS
mmetsp:Transcript_54805/g.153740  ORF Transcript_54805/g.153740 Transcript_54805/m.153740 type:complete len:480 (+) Transcript_54805:1022-2461(+)